MRMEDRKSADAVKIKGQSRTAGGREEDVVWAGLWAGSSVDGEIPSRSLQLTTWSSPGRSSAGLQRLSGGRPYSSSRGRNVKNLAADKE